MWRNLPLVLVRDTSWSSKIRLVWFHLDFSSRICLSDEFQSRLKHFSNRPGRHSSNGRQKWLITMWPENLSGLAGEVMESWKACQFAAMMYSNYQFWWDNCHSYNMFYTPLASPVEQRCMWTESPRLLSLALNIWLMWRDRWTNRQMKQLSCKGGSQKSKQLRNAVFAQALWTDGLTEGPTDRPF